MTHLPPPPPQDYAPHRHTYGADDDIPCGGDSAASVLNSSATPHG